MNSCLPRLVIVPRALLIVEELGGFAPAASELRRHAREAVATLWGDGQPNAIAIITGRISAEVPSPKRDPGSFRPFGVAATVAGGTSVPELIGRWLVEDHTRHMSNTNVGNAVKVSTYESVDEALAAGYTSLLVLVDGAFGLTEDSPVGAIDGAESADMLCQVIAGQDSTAINVDDEIFPAPGEYAAELWHQLRVAADDWAEAGTGVVKRAHYDGAPYGIGYHVASWRCVAE